jgi:nucleoside phosphorylase
MSDSYVLPADRYHVGVVCALPHEMTAVRAMLDNEDEQLKSEVEHDNNNYILGQIGQHNVVIACLPAGVYGTNAARNCG